MLAKLEPIAERLRSELGDPSITKSSLAQLMMQFLQFMEDVAGKNVSPNSKQWTDRMDAAMHHAPCRAGMTCTVI